MTNTEFFLDFLKSLKTFASDFLYEAREWSTGRMPYFRLLLMIVMLFTWIGYIKSPTYWGLFGGLNLGIHELGHFVFMPFGEFLGILGGSLFQCLVPFIGIIMFLRQRDYFAIAFALGWEGTNLYYVSTYIYDASVMELQLVSPFGAECVHDWNWLLTYMNLLKYDHTISFIVKIAAFLFMLSFFIFGGWILKIMFQTFRLKDLPKI